MHATTSDSTCKDPEKSNLLWKTIRLLSSGQAATCTLNDTSKFQQQLAGNIYIWKIPPLTSFCPVCLLADRSTWQMELIEAGWMPECLLEKSTWACSGERSVPPSTSRCNNNRRLLQGKCKQESSPGTARLGLAVLRDWRCFVTTLSRHGFEQCVTKELKSWNSIKLGSEEESSSSAIKIRPQRHRMSLSDAQHLFVPCHRTFICHHLKTTPTISLGNTWQESKLFLQTLHTLPTTSGKNVEKQHVNNILNQCYSILLNYIILSNISPADLEVLYSNYCSWSKEKWLLQTIFFLYWSLAKIAL